MAFYRPPREALHPPRGPRFGTQPEGEYEQMGERQKRLLRLIPRTKGRAVAHKVRMLAGNSSSR